jgi:hypothetical protein
MKYFHRDEETTYKCCLLSVCLLSGLSKGAINAIARINVCLSDINKSLGALFASRLLLAPLYFHVHNLFTNLFTEITLHAVLTWSMLGIHSSIYNFQIYHNYSQYSHNSDNGRVVIQNGGRGPIPGTHKPQSSKPDEIFFHEYR